MRVENLGYRSVRVIIDIEFLRDVEAQGCEQKGVAFMEGTRRPSPPMVRTNERDGGGREQAGNFPIIPFRDVTCALSRFVIDVSRRAATCRRPPRGLHVGLLLPSSLLYKLALFPFPGEQQFRLVGFLQDERYLSYRALPKLLSFYIPHRFARSLSDRP